MLRRIRRNSVRNDRFICRFGLFNVVFRGFHAFFFLLGKRLRRAVVRLGIAHDFTVLEVDDAGAVLFGELSVVRDHDDEPVRGDFLEKLHDLHAGLAVERARGLVGKYDVGIVDQRTRDSHALHLTAGHLVGLLFGLLFQTYFAQRFHCALSALFFGYAGKREAQLYVLEHAHVRNEIVRLEYETYAPVAVGVPVLVAVFLGGDAVHLYVAAGITVESAYDVEQRGLAAPGRAQNGDELAFPELDGDAVQRKHAFFFRLVLFCDFDQFQHFSPCARPARMQFFCIL